MADKKDFTAEDLARILCSVGDDIMFEALDLRFQECPSTVELIEKYLGMVQRAIEDLLPIPKKRVLTRAAIRIIKWIIKEYLSTRELRRLAGSRFEWIETGPIRRKI